MGLLSQLDKQQGYAACCGASWAEISIRRES